MLLNSKFLKSFLILPQIKYRIRAQREREVAFWICSKRTLPLKIRLNPHKLTQKSKSMINNKIEIKMVPKFMIKFL